MELLNQHLRLKPSLISNNSLVRSLLLVTAILFSTGLSSTVAATPLSKIVDNKAGIYFEATNLNSSLKQFLNSALVKRFRKTQVFQYWLKSQDVKNLQQGLRDIESVTQQPLLPMLNLIFGESVGLAVFNNGPQKDPSLLLLTRVNDANATKEMFENWFEKTGIAIKPDTYQKIPFFEASQQATASNPSSPRVYYSFLKNTLIITENKQILQSTIDLHVNLHLNQEPLEKQSNLFNLEMYQRAQSVLSKNITGSVFLNPRIWDEHLLKPKNKIEKGIVNWWNKTGGLTAGLHLNNTVALETVILLNSEEIPLPLLDVLQVPAETPDQYSHIPQNALAVISSQLNIPLLARKIVDFYADKNPEKWKKIHSVSIGLLGGLDPITELAKTLGPNILFYSVPRKELSFDSVPFDGLVALQLSPPVGQTDTTNNLQARFAIENLINYLMNSMITHHNTEVADADHPSVLKSELNDQFKIRWIEGMGFYQPAYGMNEQQLVFASSPELIKDFFTLKSEESLAALPVFQTWKETFFQEEKQLCFFNITSIRAFIDQNSDFLAQQLAKGQGGNLERGKKKLAGLKSLLQSFDGFFFAAGLQKDQVRIVLGLGSQVPTR